VNSNEITVQQVSCGRFIKRRDGGHGGKGCLEEGKKGEFAFYWSHRACTGGHVTEVIIGVRHLWVVSNGVSLCLVPLS